jgi:hypothetical protein
MDLDLVLSRPTSVVIAVEKSETWPRILRYKQTGDVRHLPPFFDAFFIAWIDKQSGDYRWWGYYASTSEQGPMGCDALIVASIRVPIESRSDEGYRNAITRATEELWATVFKSPEPGYLEFRNKYTHDVQKAAADSRTGGDPRLKSMVSQIEVVDPRDFEQMLKGAPDR